jgi:hypothetical protein
MKSKKIFIDMYGATDVYEAHRLILCPEEEFSKRKKQNYLMALPYTESNMKMMKENLNVVTPTVIVGVTEYCHIVFQNFTTQECINLSKSYELNFLSTPFRDFPNEFPSAYRWFEKKSQFMFKDKVVLNYCNDLNIDCFLKNDTLVNENGEFKELHILVEYNELPNFKKIVFPRKE